METKSLEKEAAERGRRLTFSGKIRLWTPNVLILGEEN
jgi:hypothetical protein